MRLLRDSVPVLHKRYIDYGTEYLVEALQKYSPLRQAGDESTSCQSESGPKTYPATETGEEKGGEAGQNLPRHDKKNFPASETGKSLKLTRVERADGLVETGEG